MKKKGQIVATVAQIQWSKETENALNNMEAEPDSLHIWVKGQIA